MERKARNFANRRKFDKISAFRNLLTKTNRLIVE